MEVNRSLEEFLVLAAPGKVIPIFSKFFGNNDSPLALYEKLTKDKKNTFLLESAEHGIWSRFSFIGVNSRSTIIQMHLASGLELSAVSGQSVNLGDPLLAIKELIHSWKVEQDSSLPPLTSGLVGFFSWDLIRQIENLPEPKSRSYKHPILQLQLIRDLVVIDHLENSLYLISNVYCDGQTSLELSYRTAIEAIGDLFASVAKAAENQLSSKNSVIEQSPKSNFEHQAFLSAVESSQEFVRIGDVFQVVISQRFELENKATPLEVYRSLRSLNPSPYMYLLEFEDEDGDFAIVGSSPEALVKVNNNHAVMHPIAGSRPRGKDPAEDEELAGGLLADTKEKAEHLMLVDLARNDLLKVCDASSVEVTEFMKVVRFSHIMHLVSTVEGTLQAGQDCIDVFKATFPAGTLSGAPKPRALEIIEELEPNNRGIFGGAIGYLDFAGNADLAIAIRTAFLREGRAFVQAGAGIVLDSQPESEFQETVSKASAVIKAILAANRHI